MAWRAARSLLVLHQQLRAGAPRAAPPGTGTDEWGLIGDAAHDPTSDHTPHNFAGWGNQIVTAADFPNRPGLGLDAHKVLEDIRRSRDARVKYGISNGQMFSSYGVRGYNAWTWRPYNPANGDRHFTHGHLSVVGDARADGTQPWQTIGAAQARGTEDDDEMGASFGPINIEREGATSLTIPPVSAGLADPRPAWLNFCNDTLGQVYGLRIWYTSGNENFAPLPGTNGGLLALRSGQRFSQQIPSGTSCLSISRKAIDPAGNVVDPTDTLRPYPGHLTCAIERGPVGT
ncbi:hypothetical protein [Dactylosporangium sp. CA-233914]|uniref:hypothetical protein n=1 Tax=Dactylosporangium sp. CA-233914 TaxID=3239934 RepID=UPI003D8FEBEE